MKISLSKPCLANSEIREIKKVLDSGWLAHGPKNQEFERMFAEYIGVKHAVTLNSCASALFLAIKALNIKGEVILPSFTFSASANAIVCAGAKPVFAEIDWQTGNIDPSDIEKRITPKAQAIMPVHFAGQSCQMDEILKIAKKYKLHVIEDSAEAIGAKYNEKKTGSFGIIGCFSFFPTKNITTGEGGMITTNNQKLAETIRTLSAHGISRTTHRRIKTKKPWYRSATMPGFNMRMSNLLAAVGVEQIKKLDKFNKMRRKNAAYLNQKLENVKSIELPFETPQTKHVYQMYTIKVRSGSRGELIQKLKKKGIEASVHFSPPVHLQDYYKKTFNLKKGTLPVTEKLSESVITLPMYPQMTKKELGYIVAAVKNS